MNILPQFKRKEKKYNSSMFILFIKMKECNTIQLKQISKLPGEYMRAHKKMQGKAGGPGLKHGPQPAERQ